MVIVFEYSNRMFFLWAKKTSVTIIDVAGGSFSREEKKIFVGLLYQAPSQ